MKKLAMLLLLTVCVSAQSLSFDGVDDWIDFGEGNGDFDLTTYTIEVWVYCRENKSYQGIMAKGSTGGEWVYPFILWLPETSFGTDGVSQKIFFTLAGISASSFNYRHIYSERVKI